MKRSILAATATLALALALPAHAQGDAAKGETVFKRCQACHEVGEDAQNKVGPVLNDVMGRTAGTAEGYSYSPAMKEAGEGGLVWNEEKLAQYLTDPRGFVPKNKMAFAGLRKEDEVQDVIAYLKQFSSE